MNRPTMLLLTMLDELASQLSLCAERDKIYILSRLKHESLSFLTITLPTFCDGLEQAIEVGTASPDLFPAFARMRNGCLPKFLSGFTSRVFHKDGSLMENADPDCIFAIRQITRLLKKVEIACSDARNSAAIKSYISIEDELFHAKDHHSTSEDPYTDKVSAIIVSRLFGNFDGDKLLCGHGPGATAERLRPNERRRIRCWYTRSEPWFPSDLHALPNYGWYEALEEIQYLEPEDEIPVRVVFVPKTLKTPRVIAIEPSHVQYMQQGLMKEVVRRVERCSLTRNSVRFTSQLPNNNAAKAASINRFRATIDLSDASDRVSWSLVKRVFRCSGIVDYLDACRSRSAVLPDGTSVVLQKFASMGSAMCFPVEAIVFYCLIQAAVHEHVGIQPTARSVRNISKQIDIFGDDIIIPCGWLAPVVAKLEGYTLRVNRRKSFSLSHFRESCGGDYYKGVDIKPVYARVVIPDRNDRWSPEEVASVTSTANQFYWRGLWRTCSLLRDWTERAIRRKLPVRRASPPGEVPYVRSKPTKGIYHESVRYDSHSRFCPRTQSFVDRGFILNPTRVVDTAESPFPHISWGYGEPGWTRISEPYPVSRIPSEVFERGHEAPERSCSSYPEDHSALGSSYRSIAACFISLGNIGNDVPADITHSVRRGVFKSNTRGWV